MDNIQYNRIIRQISSPPPGAASSPVRSSRIQAWHSHSISNFAGKSSFKATVKSSFQSMPFPGSFSVTSSYRKAISTDLTRGSSLLNGKGFRSRWFSSIKRPSLSTSRTIWWLQPSTGMIWRVVFSQILMEL